MTWQKPTSDQMTRARMFWREYEALCERYQCQHYNAHGQDDMIGFLDDDSAAEVFVDKMESTHLGGAQGSEQLVVVL